MYAGLGRHLEAEPLLTTAIPAFERTENKSELALAVNALGLVRQSQKRHSDARECFARALTLFEELHGPNYAECATVLQNLARSAEATGDRVGSARALKRAKEILSVHATTP
jgi:tetratricopeptide (TPR) repeat protein